ncbi:urea transporter [Staphylococcus warneri]|uniref:urea transporter n=1 Tax=Staphylococcus warneri TaxID=1292 RepID=UPI0032602323
MKAVSIILKNISQVLLINNHYTGLLVLIALFIGDWKAGLSALIASIIAYVLAPHVNYSQQEINDGLAGFSPVLTAIALTLFLNENWAGILITLVATVLTLPVGSAIREWLKPYGIAMLTAPFVIVTWFAVSISEQVSAVKTPLNIIPGTVESIVKNNSSEHVDIIKSTLEGFSEVFLLPSIWAGLLILMGILIGSRKATVYAMIGNILGFAIVAVLGGNSSDINQGLFGYNLILTAIALGTTFKTSINTYLSTVLGLLLTVLLHLGLNTMLEPIGLPSLTMPFILATWIMLFAGRPHENVENMN